MSDVPWMNPETKKLEGLLQQLRENVDLVTTQRDVLREMADMKSTENEQLKLSLAEVEKEMDEAKTNVKTHFEVFGREWPQSGDVDVAIVRLLSDLAEAEAKAGKIRKAAYILSDILHSLEARNVNLLEDEDLAWLKATDILEALLPAPAEVKEPVSFGEYLNLTPGERYALYLKNKASDSGKGEAWK